MINVNVNFIDEPIKEPATHMSEQIQKELDDELLGNQDEQFFGIKNGPPLQSQETLPHDGDEDEHRLDTFNKLEDESISDIVSHDSMHTDEEEDKEIEATEIKTFNRSQSDLVEAPEVHLDHDHL